MGKSTATKRARRAGNEIERPLVRARREMARLERDGADLADTGADRVALLKWRFTIDEAKRRLLQLENAERVRWNKGTPETHEHIESVAVDHRQAALGRLYERDRLNEAQFRAYNEIGTILEMIKRPVAVKSSGYADQVDNGGGDGDMLIESMARVRLEATYTAWRNGLPMRSPPRGAILALIETTQSIAALARVYRVDHRSLTKAVLHALDQWDDVKAATWRNVDATDVNEIYRMIGCGMLRLPRPKVAV